MVEEVARELPGLLADTAFRASREPRWILDVGVGSGAILAALLARESAFRGLGVDLSREALAYARRNLAGAPVSLVRGDLTAPIAGRGNGDRSGS
ncbi:MAG: methyltransferase domain-containing protein [Candidatus Eisenbacteria bacterium]